MYKAAQTGYKLLREEWYKAPENKVKLYKAARETQQSTIVMHKAKCTKPLEMGTNSTGGKIVGGRMVLGRQKKLKLYKAGGDHTTIHHHNLRG